MVHEYSRWNLIANHGCEIVFHIHDGKRSSILRKSVSVLWSCLFMASNWFAQRSIYINLLSYSKVELYTGVFHKVLFVVSHLISPYVWWFPLRCCDFVLYVLKGSISGFSSVALSFEETDCLTTVFSIGYRGRERSIEVSFKTQWTWKMPQFRHFLVT